MRSNSRRILIETESRETFTLRIGKVSAARLYCERCQADEDMLDLNVAADISGAGARELIRLVESEVLHAPESSDGHLVVCRASLEQAINDDPLLSSGDAISNDRL